MSPQLLKAGFLVLDAATGEVVRILPFQYNPQQLVHSSGPSGETFSCVADYDAADALEAGQPGSSGLGIAPQLAALREIAADPPIHVIAFVWGPARIAPVQVLSLIITETMFDEALNPTAATVALDLQVASGGLESQIVARIAAAYEQAQNEIADRAPPGSLDALGIASMP